MRLPAWLTALSWAAACFAAGRVATWLTGDGGGAGAGTAAIAWSAGVAIWAAHRSGGVGLAGVALGAYLDALATAVGGGEGPGAGETLSIAFALAAVATLQAWIGSEGIARVFAASPPANLAASLRFGRASEMLRFAFAIAVASALGASARIAAADLLGAPPPFVAAWSAWPRAFAADLAGIATLVPALLIALDRARIAAEGRELERRVRSLGAELGRACDALREEAAERETSERRLGEARAHLHAAIDHAPVELWIGDLDGRCLVQNALSIARWGDVVGRRFDELPLLSEIAIRWREHRERALAGQPVRDTHELVVNGRRRLYESVVAPIRAGDQVLGIVAIDADLTERRELQLQLQQAQRMESIGRLAGGIAHDFNNLLTAMIGYSEVAMRKLGPDHDGSADLEEIRRVASRAGELTRQLLLFSRKHGIEPQVLEIDRLVLGVERMLRRVIGEHIELAVIASSSPSRVKADPGQLEQVLLNLAVNARDAMPSGGRLEITTESVRVDEPQAGPDVTIEAGEYVSLRVSDTGTGIPVDVLPRVFEPFYTTKCEGHGTGLGLALVQMAVRQAGGHLRVDSELGRGTTFVVLLPLCHEPGPESPHVVPVEPAPAGTETLLVVEDEHVVRRIAAVELRSRGYRVLEAADGEEALDVARSYAGEIHCLLTDVVMPRMGGQELAERLRPERPGIKILFASGYARDLADYGGAGDVGTAFLPKPFQPSQLSRCIRELLDRESPVRAPSSR